MQAQALTRTFLLSAAFVLSGGCSSDDDSGGGGTGGSASGGGGSGGRGGSGGSAAAGSGGSGTGGGGSGGSNLGGAGASGNGGTASGGSGGGGAGGSSGSDAAGEVSGLDGAASEAGGEAGGQSTLSFFLTSRKGGGNLDGLMGADTICRELASAVGASGRTWRAYLSTASPLVHAKDRIGNGPWFNSKGVMVAANLAQLHDGPTPMNNLTAETVLDERGNTIPGRTRPAGTANEHDIITGTQMDGTVAMGFTCGDWRMENAMARVGHFDRGGGGGQVPMSNATSWNSSHNNQGCSPTTITPGGGAGRFYCFAAD